MPLEIDPSRGFTAHDYGSAFMTLDPELLDHALHLALHSIRVSFAGADCTTPQGVSPYPDPQALYHDLQAAAELTKAVAIATDPKICAQLGDHHDRRSLLNRLGDRSAEDAPSPTDTPTPTATKPRPRKPAKKGVPK